MNKKLYFIVVVTIILLGLALRIVYLLQTKDNPLFYPVNEGLDPSIYHQRAQLIKQNLLVLSPELVYGLPLYPYFLALIYKLFGENIFVVRLIQMLLGSLSCLLIYLSSRQVFNQRQAVIALFLCSVYGMFIFYEGMLLGTSLTILFSGLIILLLLSIQRESNFKKWLFLGLVLGLCGLNQANIFLFIPFILVWFSLTNTEPLKKKLLNQFIFALTLILVIAPVTIRNYLIAQDFIPITAHSGINFYIGNNPNADGTFQPPQAMHLDARGLISDSILQAEQIAQRPLRPSQVSQFWFSQGRKFIQTQPLKYLQLLLRKLALVLNSYEIFDVVDYTFFRKKFPTVLNLPLPNLKVLLPLALLGISLSIKRGKKCLLLYLFIISFTISLVAYFVNARYRLGMVAVLIIFAGYTLDWWLVSLQKRNVKAIFLSLGGLLLFFLLTNLKLLHQDYVSEYNNLGVAYKAQAQYDLAIQAYQEALKINPHQALTRNNLGNLYNAQGRYALAIEELEKAVTLDPNLAEAHGNLAVVYTKIGKEDLAVSEYKQALALRPNLVMAHYNLGVIYQQKRKLDLAAEEFKKTLEYAPNHLFAYTNLGALYHAQGKYEQAKSHWQKALKIDPHFWPAEENLKKLEQAGY